MYDLDFFEDDEFGIYAGEDYNIWEENQLAGEHEESDFEESDELFEADEYESRFIDDF